MDQSQPNSPQESSVNTGKTTKSLFSKHGLRQVVSQRRVRFQDGEYDLDLSYICPNIIAMGLPASGVDSMYRNKEQDVASMLNKFHPNSYMIYNLAQKKYDYELFQNRVMDLGWKDHHAPALELLFKNVNSMAEFIRQDPNHVVIVHCKAGKGRTGTSIAALLYYSGIYSTVGDALRYFSYRRANTIDPKGGVTIPSQKRYINYFAEILSGVRTPNRNMYKIDSIMISGVPNYDKHGAKLFVKVMHETVDELYCGKKECIKLEPVAHTSGIFNAPELCNIELAGDIMLKFHHQKLLGDESKFRISFNTHMIDGDQIYWLFYKHDLDDAYKDDLVPGEFKLELRMTKCGEIPESFLETVPEWKKAIDNRHLYQNMFTKMSYQQGGAYDPVNNLDHVENDDFTAFLSVPIDVSATNGIPPHQVTGAAGLSVNPVVRSHSGQTVGMTSPLASVSVASPQNQTGIPSRRAMPGPGTPMSPTADGKPPALPTKKKPTLASFSGLQQKQSQPETPYQLAQQQRQQQQYQQQQQLSSQPQQHDSFQDGPSAQLSTSSSSLSRQSDSSSFDDSEDLAQSISSSHITTPRPQLVAPIPSYTPSDSSTGPTPAPTPRSPPPIPPPTPVAQQHHAVAASPSITAAPAPPPPISPMSPMGAPGSPQFSRPPAIPSTPRPAMALPSLPQDGSRPAPPPPRALMSPSNASATPIVIQPHISLQPPTIPSNTYTSP